MHDKIMDEICNAEKGMTLQQRYIAVRNCYMPQDIPDLFDVILKSMRGSPAYTQAKMLWDLYYNADHHAYINVNKIVAELDDTITTWLEEQE